MHTKPRVVFFGTTNNLSLAAFCQLLASNVVPLAVFIAAEAAASQGRAPLEQLRPAPPVGQLPLLNRFHQPTLIQTCWSAGIPLYAVRDPANRALGELVSQLRPEAACVACFPQRLPADLIAMPSLGFLNVHPSLLPYYRGPAPLFWLFRNHDLNNRAVTVHQMDAELDTGPIVVQKPVRFASGLDQAAIESQCGDVGGLLVLEAIDLLRSGQTARPQLEHGSYHPWPSPADYTLQSHWSALRAFNFMRATDGNPAIYPLILSGRRFDLLEAMEVDPHGCQASAVLLDGQIAHLQFNPGILTVRFAPT
jgi:methionyl-tRNA formyltransferase